MPYKLGTKKHKIDFTDLIPDDRLRCVIRTYLQSEEYHAALTGQAWDVSVPKSREVCVDFIVDIINKAQEYWNRKGLLEAVPYDAPGKYQSVE